MIHPFHSSNNRRCYKRDDNTGRKCSIFVRRFPTLHSISDEPLSSWQSTMERPISDALVDSDKEDDDIFNDLAMLVAQGKIPGFAKASNSSSSSSSDGDGNFTRAPKRTETLMPYTSAFKDTTSRSNQSFLIQIFSDDFACQNHFFSVSKSSFREIIVQAPNRRSRKKGIHPRIRHISSLRVLSYGLTFDITDEL